MYKNFKHEHSTILCKEFIFSNDFNHKVEKIRTDSSTRAEKGEKIRRIIVSKLEDTCV